METEKIYQEREKRVMDAIALKKPDRVPALAMFGLLPAKMMGTTFEVDMNDPVKHYEANYRANLDLMPDLANPPLFFAPILEALDFKQLKWPGYGLSADASFQFVEGEYMKADEYDAFLYDPTDFIIRTYWPRVFGKMNIFGPQMMPLRDVISYYMGANAGFIPFGMPQALETMEALRKAGEATIRALNGAVESAQHLAAAGFPLYFGGCTQAPFDTLADYFRGTKGSMIDMYRQPEKVVRACEKLLPMMLEYAIGAAKMSGNPRVLIPLHKGAEGFMSIEQFKKFYWPTFRELLISLINEGLTPICMVQGGYTSRLDIISNVPVGKVCYWFESVDLMKARATLAGKVCIKGLLPMSLLVAGSIDEVKAHCKILIDALGKDGGYIMGPAAGSLQDAKVENVRAMFEFTREYGVYK